LFIVCPPQIQCTKSCPIPGTADKRLVITVAPQKLICPHGKTYPIKATTIETISMITPLDQTR